MIEPIDTIPEKSSPGAGQRMKQVLAFMRSHKNFGQYKLQEGEKAQNIYHSFKHAIIQMGLEDKVDITIRGGKLYFMREDKQ